MARAGRSISSPPQLGQRSSSASAQVAQKVHSKLQINAPGACAGKSAPQRSQSGRISSIAGTTSFQKPFQAIPSFELGPFRTRKIQRMQKAPFFQSRFHSPEIASRARQHNVCRRAIAAPRIWEDVVVLKPHAHEGRMLSYISARPTYHLRIRRHYRFSD